MTKIYQLIHQDGLFEISLSQQVDKTFVATLIWNVEEGTLEDDNRMLYYRHKSFKSDTEQGAYKECIEWVNQNLPGRYEIVEKL
jgi:hypothetical protein